MKKAALSLFLAAAFAVAPPGTALFGQNPPQSVLLLRQGRLKSSERKYEEAIALFEQSILLQPSAAAYEGRGVAKKELGKLQEAIADFNAAIQLDDKKASLYFNRGVCFISLKQAEDAIKDLSKAMDLEPKIADRCLNLRGTQYFALQNYLRAVEDFEAALKLNPNNVDYDKNREAAAKALKAKQEHLYKQAEARSDQKDEKVDLARVNRPVRSKWALIIGVSNFKDTSLNLKFPAKDAQDLAQFLIKEQNFKPDHVTVLTDAQATRANILSYLGQNWLPKQVNRDDLVVFFFSGHGSPAELDETGVSYLCPYDLDVKNVYGTGISMQRLASEFKERVPCDRVILIIDACHSAATAGKGIKRTSSVDAEALAVGTGQLVICSSDKNERSWESKQYNNGVFTKWLMEGLRRGGADATLGKAFDFMKVKVAEEVLKDRGISQTPVLRSRWQGTELRLGVATNQ